MNLAHAHNLHRYEFLLIHAIALQKLSHECSYKFIWILTLTEVISIWILRMLIIYTIMNFYWSMLLPFKNCPISSYKFSWILTLTEIRSIRILHLRLISAIMNFYLNFNSNRSYKHLNLAHAHKLHHYEFLLVNAIAFQKLSKKFL